MNATTVDPAEVERFSRIADEWWDAGGKFAPLHRLNPARVGFVRDHVAARFNRDPLQPAPLAGLRLLDIGCGGGLVCEPMCRLGADVVGIDASDKNVAVAKLHAERMRLAIDYRCDTAEALQAAGEAFDVVLALEIIEHVAEPGLFLNCCADLVRPGGLLILSTLNRTAKAFALGIVGAEYVLGWLPRGTHDWRKFVKPSEAARPLRTAGLSVETLAGLVYSPVTGRWRVHPRDLDVNYLMVATKAA
ncbi:bifunctional 2-polyprenyl-6-hydroxyphenol methylase/3-demethylubiquinol 3-O-methyltransferase UbiG [Reyranella sp. CPCC 100927]|uniref:bifunctional 2-polyprenyl-6-hydroxyphenol methylase/3-demethylubiquinol 3-O-methyltransferase UbiG n=1 Tax=Reyranella sp. CPCC 100927 TaxID=2599616 RepID=UPI0011B7C1CE|nr:bifunctional 2-polyprenyl-6-hydroxyphenol methylase/3-demethylubiquinol 3-O-methyltransferase UbiG [Reyranella sp. CPCC 100927]TWT08738.1 bifunctional 2-polyprenyl-6-hydroxyphenol methylase/3-demethylubiquinol 3-O-methyltransferase UbiG [Reyranella sp. CPCC 100927]